LEAGICEFLETGRNDVKVIVPRGNVDKTKDALGIADFLHGLAGSYISQNHSGANYRSSICATHQALQRALLRSRLAGQTLLRC
jgi:hypothetical protein